MAVTLRAQMRRLSGQSLVYGMSGALTKLVGLVMVPILLHIFAQGDYGTIEQIGAFSSLVGGILILGSDAAVAFYYYREPDERGRAELLSTWMIFQLGMNILVGAALYLGAGAISRLLLVDALYIQIVAGVLPLSTTVTYILEILRLQMRPARYLLISGVAVVAGVVLTLRLVVALRLGVRGVYIGSACTNVISFGLALMLVRGSLVASFTPRRLLPILRYGLPLVPITVATWAISQSNRFFIHAESKTGAVDLGLFAAGNKVAQVMLLFVTAFTLAWSPFALSIAAEQDARRTYAKVLTFYTVGMGTLALALSLFAPVILRFVSVPSYARAYQVVAPLSLAYMVAGAYSIVALGTSLKARTAHLSWTTILGAITALLLNLFLLKLPYMALVGGALATLGGQIVSVGLVFWISQRLYPIPYERRKVLICVAMLGAWVVVGQVLRGWLDLNLLVGTAVRLLMLAAFLIALLWSGVLERYEVVVLRDGVRSRLRAVGRRG